MQQGYTSSGGRNKKSCRPGNVTHAEVGHLANDGGLGEKIGFDLLVG